MTDVSELIERLRDLLKQATEERSHYYVGKCVRDSIDVIEAQAREIAAMREDLSKASQIEFDRYHYKAECGRLESRLAAAERDAERYRWLRVDPSLVVGPSYVLRRTDELDAAIDAAREGK